MGPTATGKTSLAIELTQKLPCDIISVDSSMVYRGMDIGSAKPTLAEQELAPHRLIDIRDPIETYSAGDFRDDAIHEIEDILAQERIPLLVGGTMLYFKALQQGLAKLPKADQDIRDKITAEAEQQGWDKLYEKLVKIDPESAQRIHPNDPQRLQRALEIYEITGKSMTAVIAAAQEEQPQYNFVNIALMPESRAELHEKIEQRFDQMLQDGLINEVEQLISHISPCRGGSRTARGSTQKINLDNLPTSLRAVNYRQVCQYLAGEIDYETMREKAIIATRQLAKRQITWLRSWQDANVFCTGANKMVVDYISSLDI